jgi:biopolymer transport protein ExbD
MKIQNPALTEDEGFDLSPMIDIVFLLLIYFMVTTTLIRQEADLSIRLPSDVEQDEPLDLPEEVFIDINPEGQVFFNGGPIDAINDRTMPQLTERLARLRVSAERAGVPVIVQIQPHDNARHQRSMDVLNACAVAGVTQVAFGAGQ